MAHKDKLNKLKFTQDIFNKYSIEQVVDKLEFTGFKEINYCLKDIGYLVKCRK